MIRRRDWWLGVGLLAAAIFAHAAFPRHEVKHVGGMVFSRTDRWTGHVETFVMRPAQ